MPQEDAGKAVQRLGLAQELQGKSVGAGPGQPLHEGVQREPKGVLGRQQSLCRYGADLRSERLLGRSAGQQNSFQGLHRGKRWLKRDQPSQNLGKRNIGFLALRQTWRQRVDQVGFAAVKDAVQDASLIQRGRKPERGPQIGRCRLEIRAQGQDALDDIGHLAAGPGQKALQDGRVGAKSNLVQSFGLQQRGRAIVDLLKGRADAGFQRKSPQQSRTEAVDRLDADAAGRLDRLGEQLPRPRQPVGCRVVAFTQFGQCRHQIGIRGHRPAAQRLEQPVLHLGGGGLGVGQAQDRQRVRTAQQEPRHAVGEHAGLARPGICGKPGVQRRVCRATLEFGCFGHPTSSGVEGLASVHSPSRERWSKSRSRLSLSAARRAVKPVLRSW